jgi:parallel beta-helix repeat protein
MYPKKEFIRNTQYTILITTLILFCLILPQTSQAATYYVDIDGVGEDGILGTTDDVISNDTNPGTSSAPWKTLTKAQATLVHGDTVLVRNGNYGSLSFVSTVDSNNWTEKITYKAALGHTPVLTYLESNSNSKLVHRYLEFDGLTINVPDDGVRRWAIYFRNSDYLRILNCTVNGVWKDPSSNGMTYYGIMIAETLSADMNDILIENCYVQNCAEGIAIYGSPKDNVIFRNNTIYHTSGSGMNISCTTNNNTILIEGNYISGQESVGGAHASGLELRARNLIVRNNIIHNFGNTSGITTYPSTFNGQGGFPSGGFTNMLFENNLVYDTRNINTTWLHGIGQNFVFRNNTLIGKHWGTEKYALWYGAASDFTPWDPNFDGSGLIIANNVLVGILNVDKQFFSKAIITGNVVYSFGNTVDGWYNSTEFPGNIIVKTNNSSPNPTYFEGSGTFFEGGELFDQYSYTRPGGTDPHGINLGDSYKLASGSSAIGFANSSYAPATDILGNPRDSQPDAGAYEYISTAPPSILYGDISGDNAVNLSDALMAAQSSAGLITLDSDQTTKGDVSRDGKVSAYDAALIAQRAVGLISKFPMEQ